MISTTTTLSITIPGSVFLTYDSLNYLHEWFADNGIRKYSISKVAYNVVEIDIWGLHAEQDMVAFKLKFGV